MATGGPPSRKFNVSQNWKQLLNAICSFLRRYVCRSKRPCLFPYMVHTWQIEAFDSPSVLFSGKRAGRSTLLDVLELLVRKPWRHGPSALQSNNFVTLLRPATLLQCTRLSDSKR
jgi:hypothetical protein